MVKYIDAHCHIQNSEKATAVLAGAVACGVEKCISNATTPNDWDQILSLAKANPSVLGAIGVHPWHATSVPDDWPRHMQNILATNPDIMVGEIGLDKNYPGPDIQTNVFNMCMDIATKFSRPVFIHCVGAWDQLLHIFKTRGAQNMPPAIIMHAFAGPRDVITQLNSKYENVYFSYSPMIMDARHKRAVAAVQNTENNQILVESDSGDPAVVPDVVRTVAKIKSIDPDKMADIIYSNTIEILK